MTEPTSTSSSSLQYKGAGFTGPPWAVLAALVIVAVAALVGLSLWLGGGDDEQPTPTTTSTSTTTTTTTIAAPFVDPYLNDLYVACVELGELGACDELYAVSPVGSEYEFAGSTCGYITDELFGSCLAAFGAS